MAMHRQARLQIGEVLRSTRARLDRDTRDNLEFTPTSHIFGVDGQQFRAQVYAFKRNEDGSSADVVQCRTLVTTTGKKGATSSAWTGDTCPHAGGLDQNIYGDLAP